MFSNRAMESRSWIYKIRNNGDLTISSCWNGTAEFSIPYLCIFIWTHSMNVNFEWTDFVVNKIRPRRELHEEFWYISLSKKVSMGTTKREVTNHDAGEECCRQIMSRNDYYWLKKTFLFSFHLIQVILQKKQWTDLNGTSWVKLNFSSSSSPAAYSWRLKGEPRCTSWLIWSRNLSQCDEKVICNTDVLESCSCYGGPFVAISSCRTRRCCDKTR